MLALVKEQNAWPTWCLSNHDCERVASRIGPDAARAMALFILGLPGSAYIYNGQELGLPSGEMEDQDRQDPIFFRTGGKQKGRDGARVPMPWNGAQAPFGFTTGKPWLPMQDSWQKFTVELLISTLPVPSTLYPIPPKLIWVKESTMIVFSRLLVPNREQTRGSTSTPPPPG